MTENNKLFNALNQLQLNTNNNDLKALEKEIFTEDNLKNIKADEGSDLYNFLNGTDIKKIINNGHQIEDGIIISFYTRFLPTANFHVLHVPGHYKTADEKNNEIFDSIQDGRQFGNCCGIHAIEGVLIAEKLTEESKSIEEFKDKVKKGEFKLTKTSNENLLEQRKILFKMEILDALNNGVENGNIEGIVLDENKINNLYNLYFEEFQARCAAYQQIKQQIKQEKEVQKDEKQQENTSAQQPEAVKKVVVESPTETKPQYKAVAENTDEINNKKFDLPEPKQKDESINTQETIAQQERDTPTEPNPSMDSQSSTSSILSEHPKMKLDTIYNWTKEEDTGIKTYDIEDNKISEVKDINKKAAKLYLNMLKQVIHEAYKKGNLETITEEIIKTIKKQTEDKVDACFTIRDENNNIVENLTEEDKTNLDLAKKDYKERAKVDEQVIDIFNQLNEWKNIQGAAKEIENKLLQKQTITSKE